jgi:hypothetical protein
MTTRAAPDARTTEGRVRSHGAGELLPYARDTPIALLRPACILSMSTPLVKEHTCVSLLRRPSW